MIVLTLPYPISANRYWTTRVVVPKATKKPMAVTHPSTEAQHYREEVGWRCKAAGIREPLAGRVRIGVQLFPHRPQDWAKRAARNPETWDDDVRCIDLDNANKVLLDALKGIAIEDDRWVREIHSQRMEPDGEARVVVTITPLVVVAAQGQLIGAAA